jgi:hypothetical protein
MEQIFPIITRIEIVPGRIDITNGVASSKFTQGLTQSTATEQTIIAAVKKALGDSYEFVATHSMTNQGQLFSVSMAFMDDSNFPVGVDVSATVDTSSCPPLVTGITKSNQTLSAEQPGGPTNVGAVFEGITPFSGDSSDAYFPFVKYGSIQQAAAPDLKSITDYTSALGNAVGNINYGGTGSGGGVLNSLQQSAMGAFNIFS